MGNVKYTQINYPTNLFITIDMRIQLKRKVTENIYAYYVKRKNE